MLTPALREWWVAVGGFYVELQQQPKPNFPTLVEVQVPHKRSSSTLRHPESLSYSGFLQIRHHHASVRSYGASGHCNIRILQDLASSSPCWRKEPSPTAGEEKRGRAVTPPGLVPPRRRRWLVQMVRLATLVPFK